MRRLYKVSVSVLQWADSLSDATETAEAMAGHLGETFDDDGSLGPVDFEAVRDPSYYSGSDRAAEARGILHQIAASCEEGLTEFDADRGPFALIAPCCEAAGKAWLAEDVHHMLEELVVKAVASPFGKPTDADILALMAKV